MLPWIQSLAILTVLSGLIALGSMALNVSFALVFACVCLSTLAGFLLARANIRQRNVIEQSSQMVGQFMRGQMASRISPELSDDAWTRFQHRINNLLDVIDLHVREGQAAIDPASHAAYIEKLKQTAIFAQLERRAPESGEHALASDGVGALLQQLGHNVASLFDAEEAAPATATTEADPQAYAAVASVEEDRAASAAWQQQRQQALQVLRHTLQKLQATMAQLAQRAVHPPTPAQKSTRVNSAQIEHAMQRLAEQSTVMALNVAIESSRAAAGSPIHELSGDLHRMAEQLQKLRQQVSELVASIVPAHEPVTSVPLSFVVEALAQTESTLLSTQQALLHDEDGLVAVDASMEQAA